MTKLPRKHAGKAADAENLTLTAEEREFLFALRQLPRPQAIAMYELVEAWHNGAGPDRADAAAWVLNKAAEIEDLSAPIAP